MGLFGGLKPKKGGQEEKQGRFASKHWEPEDKPAEIKDVPRSGRQNRFLAKHWEPKEVPVEPKEVSKGEKRGGFSMKHWEPTDEPAQTDEIPQIKKIVPVIFEAEAKKQALIEKRKKEMREKAMGGAVKKDLGVCIPDHAKSGEERRHLKRKPELSPFDKLRMQHENDVAEIDRELADISTQEPGEPYDYEANLDVDAIEEKMEIKSTLNKKAAISFDAVEEKKDNHNMSDRRAALEKEVRDVIASRRPFGGKAQNAAQEKSPWEETKNLSGKKVEEDEIDESIGKVETYTPKFSKTAREKFASERSVAAEPSAYGQFSVTGVYPGGDTTIISGEVTSGKINKRMSAQKGRITMRVDELKRGMEEVKELYSGEHGSIFVRGTINTIKYGDVLEFS